MIFHIAEKTRWDAAKLAGSYARSTYGRSLEDEGFIHASREDQWRGVRERCYTGIAEPLVLLVIDTDKLTSPWREEQVGDTTYPHIHGPLNPSAVVTEVPLDAGHGRPVAGQPGPSQSFLSLFLREFSFRVVWATVAMAVAALLGLAASRLLGESWALVGVAVGLLAVLLGGIPVSRRRDERQARRA